MLINWFEFTDADFSSNWVAHHFLKRFYLISDRLVEDIKLYFQLIGKFCLGKINNPFLHQFKKPMTNFNELVKKFLQSTIFDFRQPSLILRIHFYHPFEVIWLILLYIILQYLILPLLVLATSYCWRLFSLYFFITLYFFIFNLHGLYLFFLI